MVIDPKAFFEEADRLDDQGIQSYARRVKVSSRAHLINAVPSGPRPHERRALGNEKIGTTLRGIGPAL